MASTVSNFFPIDPTKTAKYPVTLSPAIQQDDEKVAKQHAAIQFNHKPELSNSPFETRVTPSPSGIDRYNLAIKADDDRCNYQYSGTQQPSESYALIYDSIKQSFTLDRISSEFTFNLRSTPTVKSSKALASAYPHLDTGISDLESSSDDLEETELDSSGANPNNPYDYRHFLNRHRTSSPVSPDLPALTSGSPLYKTAPSPKPAGPRPTRALPRRAPSPTPREEADADNEESDDGGLTIVDPDKKKRPFKTNFSHDPTNGPISLRSVASSASPAAMVPQSSESDEDEDVEEMHLETNGVGAVREEEDADVDEDEDEDEEDEDEDDIEIEGNADPTNESQDDDDDDGSLAAELEQAMESQADEEVNGTMHGIENGVGTTHGLGIAGIGPGVPRNNIRDDSSSESEEE